jgi:wobble nucleotide-excising tRNase
MINSIKIKNVATYDSVTGVEIKDLKKVNFFFGFNGSGKSTIAKYLRNLDSNLSNPIFGQCSNIGFDKNLYQILTFNEEFIDENFKRNNDFKGIFSLNQSNADIDQKILSEELIVQKSELKKNRINDKLQKLEEYKKRSFEELLNYCWAQRIPFTTYTKITLIHSGSKPNHLQEIRRILQIPLKSDKNITELSNQYHTYYETELKDVSTRLDKKAYKYFRLLESKVNKVLNEIILGNEDVDISGLINSLNSRKWIEDGVKFLEQTNSVCPFCQKNTIDSQIKEQFNKFFDETYKNKISEINRLKEEYQNQSKILLDNFTEIQNIFNPNSKVSNLIIELNKLFNENLKTFEAKLDHPNEKKKITTIKIKKNEFSLINNDISENNRLFKDSDKNKKTLITDIWKSIAKQCETKIKNYDKKESKYPKIYNQIEKYKKNHNDNVLAAKESIEILRSQTVNTKEAIDNMNSILKNSGFEGFEIDEKEKINNISRYYLKRSNSSIYDPVFSSLSEGEKNFISFLYFYQLCLGTDDIQNNGSKKKIIVIDDPVSSLDSQALFIVSTLIHSLTERKGADKPNSKLLAKENIIQIFVLTHNLYFYKEISFDRRPICSDFWHFKIMKMNNKTLIEGKNKKSINDDYSLMWETIKELKENLPINSSYNILISNLMRRIIESYVNFIGYGKESWAAILNEEKADPKYYLKCAFISTINDDSHKVSALDSIYYQKLSNEQPISLFNIFASIFKTIGKEHYEKMMSEQLI